MNTHMLILQERIGDNLVFLYQIPVDEMKAEATNIVIYKNQLYGYTHASISGRYLYFIKNAPETSDIYIVTPEQ